MLKLLVADIDICRISKILGKHRLKSSITYSTIIIDTDEIPQNVVDMLFANATIVGAQNYQHEDSDTSDYVETKSENDDESAITSDVEESESNHANESDGKSGESSTETGCDEVPESKEDMPVKEPTHIIESEDESIDSEYYMEVSDNNLEDFGIESEEQNSTAKNKVPKSEMVYRGEVYKWGSIRDDDDGEGANLHRDEVERMSTEQQRQGVEISGLRNDVQRGNRLTQENNEMLCRMMQHLQLQGPPYGPQ